MSTIKVDNLQTTSGAGQYTCKAWEDYSINPASTINDSAGVSSISDLGPGYASFSLISLLPVARGSTTNACGLYSNASWPAVQSSSKVATTSTWEVKCGGDTSGAQDWQRGDTSVIG